MEHKHTETEQGCCATDEPVFKTAHNHDDGHEHAAKGESLVKMFLPAIFSLSLLLIAIVIDSFYPQIWFRGWPGCFGI